MYLFFSLSLLLLVLEKEDVDRTEALTAVREQEIRQAAELEAVESLREQVASARQALEAKRTRK